MCLEILMIIFVLSWHVLPPPCVYSPLWRSLLRAVWCHPFTGVARLLQRLTQLWVGHWGWARKLHQDQLWQVSKTVLQLLGCGDKNISRACTNFFVCVRACKFTVLLHLSGIVFYLFRCVFALSSENKGLDSRQPCVCFKSVSVLFVFFCLYISSERR